MALHPAVRELLPLIQLLLRACLGGATHARLSCDGLRQQPVQHLGRAAVVNALHLVGEHEVARLPQWPEPHGRGRVSRCRRRGVVPEAVHATVDLPECRARLAQLVPGVRQVHSAIGRGVVVLENHETRHVLFDLAVDRPQLPQRAGDEGRQAPLRLRFLLLLQLLELHHVHLLIVVVCVRWCACLGRDAPALPGTRGWERLSSCRPAGTFV